MPEVSVVRCRLSKIEPLRAVFLQELNAQVRYDAAHTRSGTTEYLVRRDGHDVGYGSVKDVQAGAGTVFEFYLLPVFRTGALDILRRLVDVSTAEALECQSNDRFYAALVERLSDHVESDTILFAAGSSNGLQPSDAMFRRRAETIGSSSTTPNPWVTS